MSAAKFAVLKGLGEPIFQGSWSFSGGVLSDVNVFCFYSHWQCGKEAGRVRTPACRKYAIVAGRFHSTIIYQFKDARIPWTNERAIKVVKSKRIHSKSFVPWVLLRQGTLDNSFLLQCLFFTMWLHHLILCPYVPIEEFNK